MALVVFWLALAVLGLAASRYGADSRDGQDWHHSER